MRSLSALVLTAALASAGPLALAGCNVDRAAYPTADGGLALTRVVLYRNGIGYFERVGEVDGDVLSIKVRKDQVNDLLKSLTVVEAEGGKAVSISMPLDSQSWANAALATLDEPETTNEVDAFDLSRALGAEYSADEIVEGRTLVDGLPEQVEHAAKRFFANGNGQRRAGVGDTQSASESVG